MRHLDLAEVAHMLASGSPSAESCRHLAEVCPACGDRLRQVEALMHRFRHWDPEIVVREGLEADRLLAALLEKGSAGALEVEQNVAYQTWGVAWAALEKAQALLSAENDAARAQSRELALLAATIAGHLGEAYHPESVFDLKALAYATAAAAEPRGATAVDTLRHVAAAVTALDQGTGEEAIATEVGDLLSRLLRQRTERSSALASLGSNQ